MTQQDKIMSADNVWRAILGQAEGWGMLEVFGWCSTGSFISACTQGPYTLASSSKGLPLTAVQHHNILSCTQVCLMGQVHSQLWPSPGPWLHLHPQSSHFTGLRSVVDLTGPCSGCMENKHPGNHHWLRVNSVEATMGSPCHETTFFQWRSVPTDTLCANSYTSLLPTWGLNRATSLLQKRSCKYKFSWCIKIQNCLSFNVPRIMILKSLAKNYSEFTF